MKQVKIGGGQRLRTHRQLLAIRYPHEKKTKHYPLMQ